MIDSLSSLFNGVPAKGYFALIKDLLFYFKSLTKKHSVGIVYTNNSKDSNPAQRVTDVKNIVGEPLSWAIDKQIYATQLTTGETNYIMIK